MIDVLIGKNKVLIDKEIKDIEKAVAATYGDLDRMEFNMADRDFKYDLLNEAMHTISLFGNYQFIILRYSDKDSSKLDEASLIETLTHFNDFQFVLVLEKKLLASSKLKKMLDKNAKTKVVVDPREADISHYIRQQAKERFEISEAAARSLASRVKMDLVRLQQELLKLENVGEPIEVKHIEMLVSSELDDNVFRLSDALLKKDGKTAIEVYQELLAQRLDPIALMGLVASSLRRLYQVGALSESGYGNERIASTLDMSDKQVGFILRNQYRNSWEVLSLLNELGTIDQGVKLGKIDRFIAFELFLMKVVGA
ncbi:MAG: DNA polymerase III subunit delta [Erysipelothrix sp.]